VDIEFPGNVVASIQIIAPLTPDCKKCLHVAGWPLRISAFQQARQSLVPLAVGVLPIHRRATCRSRGWDRAAAFQCIFSWILAESHSASSSIVYAEVFHARQNARFYAR
jgi:hypothetical protein